MANPKVKVKICGLTSLEDAHAAAAAGADYLGFIINFPASPRHQTPEQAKAIIKKIKLKFPAVKRVGVFVDQPLAAVKKIAVELGLDAVQFHGSEAPEYCRALFGAAEVWKTIVVKTADDLKRITAYRNAANKILFDAGAGSGRQIDCSLLENVAVDILAGGLGPDNVAAAINRLHPAIVDLNSGVESSPGKKDPAKISAAWAAVKNAL